MKNLPKAIHVLIRITVSFGLIIFFIHTANLDRLFDIFKSISFNYWLYSYLSVLILQIISTFRWQILCNALGFKLSWREYFFLYFVGMFFNLFLPTAIGGDVVKAIYLSKENQGKLKAVYSILADRGLGLGGMFILGGIAYAFDTSIINYPLNVITIILTLGTILGLIIAPKIINFVFLLSPKIRDNFYFIKIYWERPKVLIYATILSIIIQIFANLSVWFISAGMNLNLSFSYYCVIYPLVCVITLLPISLSGIGVREGSFVYFLGLNNIPTEKALIISFGSFLMQALVCLIGGIFFMLGLHKRK